MQKLVYLSNSRNYTEQGNVNKNKYFTQVNGLLDVGWRVAHMTHDVLTASPDDQKIHKETYVSFVLLEKNDEDE
ncbi:MAG: hypothetical protein K2N38_00930 [Oscillospiraceae bacterium]|nr:hypothetical protein [Oscillospiraceae bacterium]